MHFNFWFNSPSEGENAKIVKKCISFPAISQYLLVVFRNLVLSDQDSPPPKKKTVLLVIFFYSLYVRYCASLIHYFVGPSGFTLCEYYLLCSVLFFFIVSDIILSP